MDDTDRPESLAAREDAPLALRRSLRESERAEGRRATLTTEAKRFALLAGASGIVSAAVLPVLGPLAIPAYVGFGVSLGLLRLAINAWRPRDAFAKGRIVRALREKTSFEGVVVPIEEVRSPDGDCVAFDLLVQRCSSCDCVTPCTPLGGEFVWEERRAGVFLVRGEAADLLVERSEVHFETTLGERTRSRFIRLVAGERVVVHGDLLEDPEGPPPRVRGLLGSLREARRLLRPAPDTPILVRRGASLPLAQRPSSSASSSA